MELNDLDSINGISDDELDKRFKKAVEIEKEILWAKDLPYVSYDEKEKKVYYVYKNGDRVLCQ